MFQSISKLFSKNGGEGDFKEEGQPEKRENAVSPDKSGQIDRSQRLEDAELVAKKKTSGN
jgi:hypothetical protein